jgi:hypothetical protein
MGTKQITAGAKIRGELIDEGGRLLLGWLECGDCIGCDGGGFGHG